MNERKSKKSDCPQLAIVVGVGITVGIIILCTVQFSSLLSPQLSIPLQKVVGTKTVALALMEQIVE